MNPTLLKSVVALVPPAMLLSGSLFLYSRTKTFPALIQVFGAGCLLVVVLSHVCEAVSIFPAMRWGEADSVGHYLDLWGAVLGLTLFPLGYLFHGVAIKGVRPKHALGPEAPSDVLALEHSRVAKEGITR